MRICTSCLDALPASEFSPDKRLTHGCQSVCKRCKRKAVSEWRKAHPDIAKARARKQWQTHREERLASQKIYRQTNVEKRRATSALWEENNKDKRRFYNQSRANRRRANGGKYILSEWNDALALFDNRCAYCAAKPEKLQMEHVVPLSKGGPHSADNIVPACSTCNMSKGNKSLLVFLLGAANG